MKSSQTSSRSRIFYVFLFLAPWILYPAPLPSFASEVTAPLPAEMALIPGGAFRMGSEKAQVETMAREAEAESEWFRDEMETRAVEVASFYIDRVEVTNAQYKKFDPHHEFASNLADHPVTLVTWEKADAFCRWTGKRLPTEAEWEKAARGTDARIYPWGNTFDAERANSLASASGGTRVGQYKLATSGAMENPGTMPVNSLEAGKSPYGLYHMAGNLWEWVDGWADPKKGLRLLKGGSWMSPPISLRVSTRLPEMPGVESNEYGFRCARDANTVPDTALDKSSALFAP